MMDGWTDGWLSRKIYKKKLTMVLLRGWDHIIFTFYYRLSYIVCFLKIINMHFFNQKNYFYFGKINI